MRMRRAIRAYSVDRRATLLAETGTELKIAATAARDAPASGEKIQWYLASELRERIRQSGVRIRGSSTPARARNCRSSPASSRGELLHQLPARCGGAGRGLRRSCYLQRCRPANQVGLYRSGTRIVACAGASWKRSQRTPWSESYLQGHPRCAVSQSHARHPHPASSTTPRSKRCVEELAPLEARLRELIEAQTARRGRAGESRDTLKSIQRAFREAMLALPAEEYDWFDIQAAAQTVRGQRGVRPPTSTALAKSGRRPAG